MGLEEKRLDNTVQNDVRFFQNRTVYDKNMTQHIGKLKKNNTKVSSYDDDEVIKRLARIMNYCALLDEMDVMKDLEMTEDLDERLHEITFAFNCMELSTGVSQKDLEETKKIFKELAEDPEKRDKPITEAIIKEAYGRYYKKNKIEPKSMSFENFDKYLESLFDITDSNYYQQFKKLANTEDYQEYEEEYNKKNNNSSLIKDIKDKKMDTFLSEVSKIRKAIRENPVALFDKDKTGENNNIFYSQIFTDLKNSFLQKFKNRDFQIPDEYRKSGIHKVCGDLEEWFENFDKNVEFASTYAKIKKETNTVGAFENHLNRLENSLTTRNSDEYKNIIKMVRLVNTKDKLDQFEKFGDLTDKQNYALKLLAIKNSINKYIGHKAEHGVNKNVGGKLAAVEALNAEVSKRLSSLNLPPFTVGDKTYDIKKYAITEKQEYKVAEKVNQAAASPYNPDNRADENANLNDACMKRIILKAIEKNYSSQIPKLERARHLFERNEEPQAPQAGGPKL